MSATNFSAIRATVYTNQTAWPLSVRMRHEIWSSHSGMKLDSSAHQRGLRDINLAALTAVDVDICVV